MPLKTALANTDEITRLITELILLENEISKSSSFSGNVSKRLLSQEDKLLNELNTLIGVDGKFIKDVLTKFG